MMTAATSPVGILRSPAALRPYAAPRRQATSCSFQLCPAPARLRAMSRPAPRPSPCVAPSRLRCVLSGESACVEDDDEEYEDLAPLPWLPSEEEVEEFLALDMSRAAVRERFRRESVEARAVVLGAVADVLRPLRDNFNDVRNLKNVHENERFHIDMPFGALMTCIGMYQLWNFAPSLCLDVAMPYAFYKLSVLAADVRRRGFSPDLIIRIKLALAQAMVFKDIHLKCTPLDYYIRLPVYFIYTLSVLWDFSGMKKFAKYALPACFCSVLLFFYKPELTKKSNESNGHSAKGDSEVLPCVDEPKSSSDAKEGGQTLQFPSEPNDSTSSETQDGEALQSVSAPDNHIHTTVKQEGEPLQVFVSEPENLY